MASSSSPEGGRYIQVRLYLKKNPLVFVVIHFQKALEKRKVANYIKRAIKDVAEFNAQLAQQRREERCSYFDMQTQVRLNTISMN